MWDKKYIFETNKNRVFRLCLNIGIFVFIFLSIVASICAYIPIHAQKANTDSEKELYQKSPDLIAIFTGDTGRINYGLELAAQYPSAQVLISGVYTKANLKAIIKKQNVEIPKDNEHRQIDPSHFINLDYKAQNTIENIIYTLRFLKEKKHLNNVLIISSDYHILRIQILLKAMNRNENFKFYFHGLETDYSKWNNIKKLIMEIFKLTRGVIMALAWEV